MINLFKEFCSMDRFELVSKFKPTGDQPQAIDALAKGVSAGYKEQVLICLLYTSPSPRDA